LIPLLLQRLRDLVIFLQAKLFISSDGAAFLRGEAE
jgi:hypothetical protein